MNKKQYISEKLLLERFGYYSAVTFEEWLEIKNKSMTVQELIDALNKVEDKSKDVVHYDYLEIEEIDECDNDVILY